MRWRGERASDNVEDRRGQRPRRAAPLGIGALLAVLAIGYLTDTDPRRILSLIGGMQTSSQVPAEGPGVAGAPQDEAGRFAAVVLASTETVWNDVLARRNLAYQQPRLVLFSDAVESACGFTGAAVGPFYCPADSKVYLDLSFFRELASLGAPGDFAQAYVIAHEVGHHVQNQLGISDQVSRLQRRASETQANALSVRLELQADCLAGVWGHFANAGRKLIEPGDVEEGLAAAAAIGDDRLQREAGARVQPESWTHGSSDQRVRAFQAGLQAGTLEACDSFGSEPR
jgi:predicted metalloprotease